MAEIIMSQMAGTPALDGKYIAEMDMWPLETQELNRNYQSVSSNSLLSLLNLIRSYKATNPAGTTLGLNQYARGCSQLPNSRRLRSSLRPLRS